MIILSLCLSDIPKGSMKISEKNGKFYINLICDKRREVGKYEETHTLAVSQSKEERESKKEKTYVGSGKEYIFTHENIEDMPTVNVDDINVPWD